MTRTAILILTLGILVLLAAAYLALLGIRGVMSGEPTIADTAALLGSLILARSIRIGD